jgi:hypothetical protein
MFAVGGFLLLWVFVVNPALIESATGLAGAVVFPSALACPHYRLQADASGGLRDPVPRLLLLAVAAS